MNRIDYTDDDYVPLSAIRAELRRTNYANECAYDRKGTLDVVIAKLQVEQRNHREAAHERYVAGGRE